MRYSSRTSELAILEHPFEVEIFNPDDAVPICEPGGELVEYIISQAGDAIVEPCNLPSCFLPVFRAEFATMEPLVRLTKFPQGSFEEGLVLDSLSCTEAWPVGSVPHRYRTLLIA